MGSSQNSSENIARFRQKTQNIAAISAVLTTLLTIALVLTNYRIIELNQNKLDALMQQQNQIEMDAQAAGGIQKELTASRTEVKRLHTQLNAEKKITQSLKGKLASTLKLLAQARELSEEETGNPQPAPSSVAISAPVVNQNEETTPHAGVDAETTINNQPTQQGLANGTEKPSLPSKSTATDFSNRNSEAMSAPKVTETGPQTETVGESLPPRQEDPESAPGEESPVQPSSSNMENTDMKSDTKGESVVTTASVPSEHSSTELSQ